MPPRVTVITPLDSVVSTSGVADVSKSMVLLVANSKRELLYQTNVLDKIIDRSGGKKFEMVEEPNLRNFITLLSVKGGNAPARGAFSPTGSFHPILCGFIGTRRTLVKAIDDSAEIKKKYVKTGLWADDGGEGGWGPLIIDHAHMEYFENETLFDPSVPESIRALDEVTEETNKSLVDKKLIVPFLAQMELAAVRGDSPHDTITPYMDCDYRIWQRKFKQVFDPNDAADSCNYIEAEEIS